MRNISCVMLFLAALLLVDCTSADKSADEAFKNIPIEEFDHLRKSNDVQLVDVRTAEEVANGRIEGSVNMDFKGSDFSSLLETLDKDKLVLLYCASGARSGRALELMKDSGFKEVYNLDGGLKAWQAAGMPVVK